MRLLAMLALALTVVGCGDDTTSKSPDLAMTPAGADMAFVSACGHPGDTGNSKGVGKYCMDSTMCTGQNASICSTVMQTSLGKTYFCTLPCNGANDTTTCAENATCACLSAGLCGCVPSKCLVGLDF